MRVSRRALLVALTTLSTIYFSFPASAQSSDQIAAERVLGTGWQGLSRRAGMIFAGTVLSAAHQSHVTDRSAQGTPVAELDFRVDEPIAGTGVARGETLQIHEWLGALSMHRPMLPGQRFLVFLYPLSRLGLTSPVGGSNGEVPLDSSGKNVSSKHFANQQKSVAFAFANSGIVSVVQLERAIRGARLR